MAKNDFTTNLERRSGMRRREDSLVCKELCRPIVLELDRRREMDRVDLDKRTRDRIADLDKRDEKIHHKLDEIHNCLGTKIPSKLFWRVVSGFGILVFVICGVGIAGTLWSIYGMVSEVKSEVQVVSVMVDNTAVDLKSHLNRAENKYDSFDKRLDQIEQGTTFFNFYNRQHKSETKPNP